MIYLVTNQVSLFENTDDDIQEASLQDLFNYFKNHEEIEFDSETRGFDPFTDGLICTQYGDYKNQFLVDHGTVSISLLKDFLENPNITWLMQNAKFDLKFLYKKGIFPKKVYDTYIAESLLHLGDKLHKKGLDSLVNRYLHLNMDKSIRKDIALEGLTNRVIRYSAEDVKYLSKIKFSQLNQLIEEDLMEALRLENTFTKVLAYIEFSGFKLNVEKWKKKVKYNKEKLNLALLDLDKWLLEQDSLPEYRNNQLDMFSEKVKTNINWASAKQVSKLFIKLGINVLDKHKKVSVDAKVVAPQRKQFPVIEIYLKYKALDKIVSTYGDSFLSQVNKKTKRIHTNFNQLMDTSRLSSGGNNTINFQNIPAVPEYKEEGAIYERECFEPEPGNTFIVSDYSGQEAVIFANKCLDPNLLDFYDKGLGDQHSYVAKLCYPEELKEVSLEEVKILRKDLRQNAKAAGFALQFGGVGATIAANLGIPVEEGNKVEKAYFKAFPGIDNYFKKVCKDVLSTGEIVYNEKTRHKRKFNIFPRYKELEEEIDKEFWDNYKIEKAKESSSFYSYYKPAVSEYFYLKGIMERTAKNAPVQGTAAAMTKLALILIFNYILENNLQGKVLIANVIHDEIVVECPLELAGNMSRIVKDSMETAGKYFCKRVPLKADPYIGPDWTH